MPSGAIQPLSPQQELQHENFMQSSPNLRDGDRANQLKFWACLIHAQWEDLYSTKAQEKIISHDRAALIPARTWFESDNFDYATSFRVACEHLSWNPEWVRKIVFAGPLKNKSQIYNQSKTKERNFR